MKRRKQQPQKGNRVVSIESYVTSKQHGFENITQTFYYIDTKRGIIWEEYGIDVGGLMRPKQPYGTHYQSWPMRIKPRSLNQLIAKYDKDFQSFATIFDNYSLNVTEIGVL